MKTLNDLARESASPAEFVRAYARYLATVLASVDAEAIAHVVRELDLTRAGRHTLFIAGNGGSAATAAHMANDLSICVNASQGDYRLDARCLSDNIPALTAIANDRSFRDVFVRQLEMAYRPCDRLLVLSASGNSPNVVDAARWVKQRGGVVMGLVGFDGGELRQWCDVLVHIKTSKGEYGPVEDLHLIIDHMITVWLQSRTAAQVSTAVTP